MQRAYIREWRRYRGLKQSSLAHSCHMTEAAISHIETGRRGYSQASLETIAEALDTRPGYLLEFNPFESRIFVVHLDGASLVATPFPCVKRS